MVLPLEVSSVYTLVLCVIHCMVADCLGDCVAHCLMLVGFGASLFSRYDGSLVFVHSFLKCGGPYYVRY